MHWGFRELIPCGMPRPGRGAARVAWAQAALGFRAAAVLEQRQGQMAAGLALATHWAFGRARSSALAGGLAGWDGSCPRLCPGPCAGCCRVAGATRHPPALLPARPGPQEVFPSAPRCQPALEAFARLAAPRAVLPGSPLRTGTHAILRAGACGAAESTLPLGAHPGQPWGAGVRDPLAAAPAPRRVQRWGRGMCRIGARGWAGFLRHKIPGRLPRSAVGTGNGCVPCGSPGCVNPAGTSPSLPGGCSRTPSPCLGRQVLLWLLGVRGAPMSAVQGDLVVASLGTGWRSERRRPLFAEPTLCPSMQIVKSSANTLSCDITLRGGPVGPVTGVPPPSHSTGATQ